MSNLKITVSGAVQKTYQIPEEVWKEIASSTEVWSSLEDYLRSNHSDFTGFSGKSVMEMHTGAVPVTTADGVILPREGVLQQLGNKKELFFIVQQKKTSAGASYAEMKEEMKRRINENPDNKEFFNRRSSTGNWTNISKDALERALAELSNASASHAISEKKPDSISLPPVVDFESVSPQSAPVEGDFKSYVELIANAFIELGNNLLVTLGVAKKAEEAPVDAPKQEAVASEASPFNQARLTTRILAALNRR